MAGCRGGRVRGRLGVSEPGEWTIDLVHSAIRVTARHLGLSSVHGRFTDFTLRGVTKPVRLDVRYLGTGPDQFGGVRCAFTASTSLRRDEFAVNWNQAVRN
jgi:polyisoprenoid-binding protein YceI